MQVKVILEEQVNLDKKYVERKLSEFFRVLKVEENFIQFEYKEESFYFLLNLDGIPEICVLSNQIKSYPHFCLHKSLQFKEYNFYSLCLYVTGEISFYHATYQEKVDYIVDQFIRLMNLNDYELEKEVMSEYRYHWAKISENLIFSNISPMDTISDIHLFEYRRRKDETPHKKFILSKKFPFDVSKYSYTQINCLYLKVIDMKGILPPPFKNWDSKLLKELLFSIRRKRFDEATCKFLSQFTVKEKLYIILRIQQFNDFEIGIKVIFSDDEKRKLKNKLNQIQSIKFMEVLNRNVETSIVRNGGIPAEVKKVLMIGCGSLGSYIVRELPKIGVNNITIVDGDNLEYSNLSRHILGEMFVGSNKAIGMCDLLSIEYENMKFNAVDKYITDTNFNEIINDESSYDLIIITTGNEDLQHMLNNQLISLKAFVPVIFCWLEANSIGSHALVMKDAISGCYNCVMNANLSYIKNSYKHIKYNGCGGVYSQYGTNILLNTTALVTDIINGWASIDSNTLYSYKTNNFMNNSLEGIQCTDHYYKDDYGINIINNLKTEECECCG